MLSPETKTVKAFTINYKIIIYSEGENLQDYGKTTIHACNKEEAKKLARKTEPHFFDSNEEYIESVSVAEK